MRSKDEKSKNQVEAKQTDIVVDNDLYLEIWKTEQEQRRTKWTITTFFMSVSFAVLGLSFQTNFGLAESFAARIVGLVIYWFAYILYQEHNKLNTILRNYLIDMERTGHVTLNLQSNLISLAQKRGGIPTSSSRSLLIFGIMYTVGIILLWFLKL